MGVLARSFASLKAHSFRSKSAMKKFRGGGNPGSRWTPARHPRIDKETGSRLDWGERYLKDSKTYQNVTFQLNRESDDPAVQALIRANGTHKKYVTIAILVDEPVVPTTKIVKGKEVALSAAEIAAAKEVVWDARHHDAWDRIEQGIGSSGY